MKNSNKTNTKLNDMTNEQKVRQKRELYNTYQFFSDNLFCKHGQALRYFNNNIEYTDCIHSCCNCDKFNFCEINNDELRTVYISNYIKFIITTLNELQNVSGRKLIPVSNLNYTLLGKLGDMSNDATNYLFKLKSFGCLAHTNQIIINNVYKYLEKEETILQFFIAKQNDDRMSYNSVENFLYTEPLDDKNDKGNYFVSFVPHHDDLNIEDILQFNCPNGPFIKLYTKNDILYHYMSLMIYHMAETQYIRYAFTKILKLIIRRISYITNTDYFCNRQKFVTQQLIMNFENINNVNDIKNFINKNAIKVNKQSLITVYDIVGDCCKFYGNVIKILNMEDVGIVIQRYIMQNYLQTDTCLTLFKILSDIPINNKNLAFLNSNLVDVNDLMISLFPSIKVMELEFLEEIVVIEEEVVAHNVDNIQVVDERIIEQVRLFIDNDELQQRKEIWLHLKDLYTEIHCNFTEEEEIIRNSLTHIIEYRTRGNPNIVTKMTNVEKLYILKCCLFCNLFESLEVYYILIHHICQFEVCITFHLNILQIIGKY